MSEKTILVWFRNDLRIHDNEILLEATLKASKIIPVYCFDPRHFEKTKFNNLKTGNFRAQFIIESVQNLKTSLKNLGGDLLIRTGKPELVIPEIVAQYKVDEVYHHREVASEETEISSLLEDALWKMRINLKHFIGHTLYHKEDLPFPIKDIPDVFTSFRKKAEKEGSIRKSFATPTKIEIPDALENSEVPEITIFGLEKPIYDKRAVLDFTGGETEGLKRVNYYLWESNLLQKYKQSRNGLVGGDYSSKISPWLSAGCISPRDVYWEVKKYEKERASNDSTYWLIFELLWRDYFRFMFKKHGSKFFMEAGFKGQKNETAINQEELFEKWKNAQTGIPFIDANMRELNLTGFMSNRGRQNVASFLVKDLKVNWTWGAAYFEEKLIDYAPASNWGNWAYVAGVGNDPREDRYFNILKQANEYDPKCIYVKLWLPELKMVPDSKVHEVFNLTTTELKNYAVILGENYPEPIIKLNSYAKY